MSKPLNLTEISRLSEGEISPEEFMNDERVQVFIDRVETAGKEILKKHRSGKYATDASDFLFSAAVVEFIMQGDMESVLVMMKHNVAVRKALGIAFIYSVGLGVVEELY